MSYRDNIFGQLFDPEARLALHQSRLQGVQHLAQRIPMDVLPGQMVTLRVTTSGILPFDQVCGWYRTEPGLEALTRLDFQPEEVTWDNALGAYVRHWSANLPGQPEGTMVRYQVGARVAGTQEWVYADNQARTQEEATRFSFWCTGQSLPAWTRDVVVYHIFMDRFYPGDGKPWQKPESLSGFFGGTLRGVIQKLDYIREMGFTAIWLSPIFPSPSHHGYDATDYFSIEPRYGTLADFQELVQQAHARGIRIILDFVANHCSHLHLAFQDAQAHQNSPYHDWFTWLDWPEDYATYFGVRELPQLNLKPGPARDYLLSSARFWFEQGVDGFRLDYAYGPSHDFWMDFRRACRQANPECWLFGEVIHTPEQQLSYTGEMDGTLDFLLCRALRETFGHGNWPLSRFEAFLSEHETYFPETFSRPAFLDNHDMNRILFIANGDTARVKLAALALFTLSGPPIVYNGTETGVSQERQIHQNDFGIFEEARLPMKWGPGQDASLRDYFTRLIHLRRQHPLLHNSPRRLLHLDGQTLAYAREASGVCVVAVFNISADPCRVVLPGLPEMQDVLNGCQVSLTREGLCVELPGRTGAFLTAL
ncbi:MAG TPA: alpha-amylase family glycosyl hydrolase [Anaerolineaceae bacterium]|nr:alpha-amylase family glycosyl hydrolase [Anaerolineaceae bacterium]HPN53829.1 alpha-amylase family glycosyl hydrolase [Anaerolineaceae bacterium]